MISDLTNDYFACNSVSLTFTRPNTLSLGWDSRTIVFQSPHNGGCFYIHGSNCKNLQLLTKVLCGSDISTADNRCCCFSAAQTFDGAVAGLGISFNALSGVGIRGVDTAL